MTNAFHPEMPALTESLGTAANIRPRSALLFSSARLPRVTLLTMPFVLAGGLLLLLTPTVPQTRWSWDFVHALLGGWYLFLGYQPYHDFHTIYGILTFLPISMAMHLGAPSAHAFHGVTLAALVVLYPLALLACHDRINTLLALFFTLSITMLILIPANPGYQPMALSFAMYYNRLSWAAISVLALILFIPRFAGRRFAAWEAAAVLLLLLALFYLKLSYFYVACLGIYYAIAFTERFHGMRLVSGLVFTLLLLGLVVLPYNLAYLREVNAAGVSPDLATERLTQIRNVLLRNKEGWGLAVAAVAVWWLASAGRRRLTSVLTLGYLGAAGFVLALYNAYPRFLPLLLVLVIVVYEELRRAAAGASGTSHGWLGVAMAIALVYPTYLLGYGTLALYKYASLGRAGQETVAVYREGPLAGFAVPRDRSAVGGAYPEEATAEAAPTGRQGKVPIDEPMSSGRYLRTLELAVQLAHDLGLDRRRLFVVDQVNFLPLALGSPPPAGVQLWLHRRFRPRPAATVFSDIDAVFVPHLSTDPVATARFLAGYGDYILAHFSQHLVTDYWTIFWWRRA